MRLTAITLSAYLLLGSFFPASDFCQLARIPFLIDHFQEHQALAADKGEDMNFLEFLSIHFYQTGEHPDSHPGSDHQDLPLQHLGSHIQMACHGETLPDVVFYFASESLAFGQGLGSGVDHSDQLFQPPIAA
jgi:hypothetical protein